MQSYEIIMNMRARIKNNYSYSVKREKNAPIKKFFFDCFKPFHFPSVKESETG